MRSDIRRAVIALVCAATAWPAVADAQWVMLARRVVGRVETMSQQSPDGATSYVTAAVIVDRPVDKVYATVRQALEAAKATEGIGINRSDDARHSVEFYRGGQSATILAAPLGDDLTHLLVSSVQPTAAPGSVPAASATDRIVERILAVCKQMNVECSRAAQ